MYLKWCFVLKTCVFPLGGKTPKIQRGTRKGKSKFCQSPKEEPTPLTPCTTSNNSFKQLVPLYSHIPKITSSMEKGLWMFWERGTQSTIKINNRKIKYKPCSAISISRLPKSASFMFLMQKSVSPFRLTWEKMEKLNRKIEKKRSNSNKTYNPHSSA